MPPEYPGLEDLDLGTVISRHQESWHGSRKSRNPHGGQVGKARGKAAAIGVYVEERRSCVNFAQVPRFELYSSSLRTHNLVQNRRKAE